MKTADPEFMRAINRFHVMDAIRRHGPISRVEIADRTDLSPMTVSAITGVCSKTGASFRLPSAPCAMRPVVAPGEITLVERGRCSSAVGRDSRKPARRSGPVTQPLTAPAVRPAMMCFWPMKKTMMVGRMVSVTKARISCQSVMNSPL